MEIKREVNESVLLMNDPNYYETHNSYYNIDKIMALGGDNFKEVCEKLNVCGQKAYCVCGSGDQSLDLITRGFSQIDCFDINILARHILNLKIAAIKTLDYKQFIKFTKNPFSHFGIYNKIEKELADETKQYFNLLFKQKNSHYIYNNLFTHKAVYPLIILEACKNNFSFYNEKEYYILKKNILEAELRFVHQNLVESPKIEGTYDFMYFSNILLFENKQIKKFKTDILPIYIQHLNDDGIIALHYMHHYYWHRPGCTHYDDETQKINNIIYNELQDVANETLNLKASGFGRGTGNQDAIIIYKKSL